jgi:hypothetical protein
MALNLIAGSEPGCIPKITQHGIVQKVLNALKNFQDNLDISKAAMDFLETLVNNPDC